jgi:hypothetical protein
VWVENKGTCYYLVLHHCLLELKSKLKNVAWSEAAITNITGVALVLLIQDVMYNKKKRAQHTMGLVLGESNVTCFTATMANKDTLDEYYKVIKA